MSAVVYDLAEYAVRRNRSAVTSARPSHRSPPTAVERCGTTPPTGGQSLEFCFWQGASGRRYVHHVFSLIECPQMPQATYILVGHDEDGRRIALHVGCVENQAPSLNLADIRRRGATIGAKEVHIHLLGRDTGSRQSIAEDIRCAVNAGEAKPSIQTAS